MAIENTYLQDQGISLMCGFDLHSEIPLDSRHSVPDIDGLNALADGKAAYKGMLVYVENKDVTYIYTGKEWKPLVDWDRLQGEEPLAVANYAATMQSITNLNAEVKELREGISMKVEHGVLILTTPSTSTIF